VLSRLNLNPPERVIQARIDSLTIQGFWKNIELDVPSDRRLFAVLRGSRPSGLKDPVQSFDSFLLDEAIRAGAELIQGEKGLHERLLHNVFRIVVVANEPAREAVGRTQVGREQFIETPAPVLQQFPSHSSQPSFSPPPDQRHQDL
jgi:hypothetical protein